MSFVKRFPAAELKCNQSFYRGKEGNEKAGNGMTFFPWMKILSSFSKVIRLLVKAGFKLGLSDIRVNALTPYVQQ
ncbi:hypothetical protein H8959_018081 [Pygathrix nigripes]